MKKTFSFIVFSFVSMSLQAQESYKYPKKMAFVIGADHSTAHAGREETYIRDNNITSTQSLTKNGYQVHNFFGNSKNAADLRQKANKSFVKPFTIENVKESLNSIYKADCENRPEQLMIDMNAHGSRFLGKAEKHSINTVDEAGQTVRIPVGDIANHIKSLQTSSCPRPKIAVIDSSCKAGGSIAEFQDLGCVMTASSISGSTRVVAAKEIYQSVGRLGGQGLDQVHLEATLNPEYGLLKEEYKGVGDVVLTKSLVNDNQIGGCEDQKFFNYEQHGDYAKVKEIVPVCHVGYLFYNEKLDHEIDSVSDILKKYNSTNDVDQETIAKVMKKKKEDIPAASDIWDSIKKIEEKNGEISLKTKDLLVEESKLISKVQNKSIPCDLAGQATTHDERSIINDKSKLEGHMSSFCAMNYKEDSEEFKTCMVMKNYKKITLKSTDLFKYHKQMVSTKDVQKSAVVTKTMQARNSKVNKELVGYESRMTNLMEKVVTQCIKDLQKTGDEDLKKFAQFYSANYIDSNCAGGKVSIYCSTQETQKLSDELKDNFAIARAYRFLACSNDTSKNNPALQKCKDFKI